MEATKADFEVAKEQVTVPFEHKEKIILLNEELSELNAELDLNKRDEVVIDDGEENEQAETGDNYTALPQIREQPTAPAQKKESKNDRKPLQAIQANRKSEPRIARVLRKERRVHLFR